MEKNRRETQVKSKIMGIDGDKAQTHIWDARIAEDLEIPYHKVEMGDYEEWQRRDFKFDPESVTKEEQDRVMDLMTGSAFRA